MSGLAKGDDLAGPVRSGLCPDLPADLSGLLPYSIIPHRGLYCRGQLLSSQRFPRYGRRPGSEGVDPRRPKGLVAGKGDDHIRHAGAQPGAGRPSAIMVAICGNSQS